MKVKRAPLVSASIKFIMAALGLAQALGWITLDGETLGFLVAMYAAAGAANDTTQIRK